MNDEVIKECKQKANDIKYWTAFYKEGCSLARWVAKKKLFNCGESVLDEIAQETMIAISKKILSIKDGCHCERMIRIVARNKAVDYIRKHQVPLEEFFEDRGYPDEELTDEEIAARGLVSSNVSFAKSFTPEIEETVINALRRSMSKLGYPCKPILRKFYLDQAKHREIAEEMGFPVNQMGMRISRCLKNLRAIFSSEGIQLEDVL